MEKTKLGVSVGLLGAGVFFSALFGGYTPVILVAGYVLLCEDNAWLKKVAVKAVVLLMAFNVVTYALGLIPDLFYWLADFINLIGLHFTFTFIYNIVGLLTSAIAIVKIVAFLALGLKALKQETIAISSIDDMVDKHMGIVKAEPEVKAETEDKAE